MIRSCLLSRKEIVDLIKKSPKTKDGNYFFPRFNILMQSPGQIKDQGYYYDRSFFNDKMCFNDNEIKAFLSKKKMGIDTDLMRFIDIKLKDTLKDIAFLELKDKIPNQEFTLEELIDSTIYLIKYRYS